jgi:hypothetical protein
VKQSIKEAKAIAMQNSFELIAIEWHKHSKPNWSSGYADDILNLSGKIFSLSLVSELSLISNQ